ncbi:MAG: YsnF/AvaK domain-containing protein [Pseudomonadota bacterium]|jgi:uncharacterized protein (TIGR02271 family)|nr:YsnF/AvaK domain-containing protein [Pseudomonadota bacterium]
MTNHSPDSPALQDAIAETEVIPLAEEELRIGKRQVTTGKVRVSTKVDVIEELAKATLDTETVEVTRVPVDRMVDQAPAIRTENDVTIIPILEEVLVVEKRLVLKEELHVRKRTTAESFEAPVQLRKQSAVIERIPADENGTNSTE